MGNKLKELILSGIITSALILVGIAYYEERLSSITNKYTDTVESTSEKVIVLELDVKHLQANAQYHNGKMVKEMEAWERVFTNMDSLNTRMKALESSQREYFSGNYKKEVKDKPP